MEKNTLTQAALRALHLMDLTALNDSDTVASIQALADAANTPVGHPAALCVYAQFVPTAKARLAEIGLADVPVATVTNFPFGEPTPEAAAQETAAAVALGADEVDVVFPWRALMAGDTQVGFDVVAQSRAAVGDKALLKVIIESGELKTPELIKQASEIAIAAGAHFIKTSTGKVPVNATLEAAEIMLTAIRDSGKDVGFKAAGGVRTAAEAAAYLALADRIMGPGWVSAKTWRFGASSLLANLLETLGHGQGSRNPAAY